jgi:hypothetical protein
MPKPNQTLNTSRAGRVEDSDVRSPRTPTYVPNTMSFFPIPPFDPSRVFASLSPTKSVEQTPPPPEPLAWVWRCHLCRSRYPLGATRRCLLDGHFCCSRETDRPSQKKKKGQSCSSEFDYIGWKEMEQWKSKARKSEGFLIAREPQGCENCEFPSQCRYTNYNLLDEHGGSSVMTESDLGTPSTALFESRTDSPSRFYRKENITFESILAGSATDVGKSGQLKVADYYRPDRKGQSSAGTSSTSTSTRLQKIMKSANRRSRGQAAFPPILEEESNGAKYMQCRTRKIGPTT